MGAPRLYEGNLTLNGADGNTNFAVYERAFASLEISGALPAGLGVFLHNFKTTVCIRRMNGVNSELPPEASLLCGELSCAPH